MWRLSLLCVHILRLRRTSLNLGSRSSFSTRAILGTALPTGENVPSFCYQLFCISNHILVPGSRKLTNVRRRRRPSRRASRRGHYTVSPRGGSVQEEIQARHFHACRYLHRCAQRRKDDRGNSQAHLSGNTRAFRSSISLSLSHTPCSPC